MSRSCPLWSLKLVVGCHRHVCGLSDGVRHVRSADCVAQLDRASMPAVHHRADPRCTSTLDPWLLPGHYLVESNALPHNGVSDAPPVQTRPNKSRPSCDAGLTIRDRPPLGRYGVAPHCADCSQSRGDQGAPKDEKRCGGKEQPGAPLLSSGERCGQTFGADQHIGSGCPDRTMRPEIAVICGNPQSVGSVPSRYGFPSGL
jgi:hypothetical protein